MVDAEDRRIDQVVEVLERYKIKVAALHESKWFSNDIYRKQHCVETRKVNLWG